MRLSPRQIQIAELIADGKNAKQIAEDLGIKHQTARVAISRIIKKRGWKTKVDIIKYVLTHPSIYKGVTTVDKASS